MALAKLHSVPTVLFLLQHWQRITSHWLSGPQPRQHHAATCFTQLKHGNFLLVVGGFESQDAWVYNVKTKIWDRVSVTSN